MLELRNITKDYAVGSDKVHALKGICLAFGDSGMVAILGQSGCGKTTLLNIIGGLDRYTDGDLIIGGRSTKFFKPSDWDAYRNQKIGFVFQSYNLIPHLTVLGNVELALTLSGIKKSERRARAAEALAKVGLAGEMKKRPNQLSGGQMQRVAIARALVNNPEIILADEPTGALDSSTSVAVMELLKEIARERLVIMVTHNRALADTYATRIISMLDGNVVSDTAPFAPAADADVSGSAANCGAEIAATSEKQLRRELKRRQNELTKQNRASLKKTSMSVWTAFGLSFRNLVTKKGRTIATAVAGSIGIIGVALVLALSNGFNGYIKDMQTSMLAHYPVTVTNITMDMDAIEKNMENGVAKLEQFPDGKRIIIKQPMTVAQYHINRITDDYLARLDDMRNRGLVIDITKEYGRTPVVLTKNGNIVMHGGYKKITTSNSAMNSMIGTSSSGFRQLLNNSDYVKSQYDILAGSYPTAADELGLVIGADNAVTETTLTALGLRIPDDRDNASFEDFIGQELKLVHNNEWLTFDPSPGKGYYVSFDNADKSAAEWEALYNHKNNVTLKITAIMRIKETASLALYSAGLVYTPALTERYLADCRESEAAKAQIANTEKCVTDTLSLQIDLLGRYPIKGQKFESYAEMIGRGGATSGLELTADDLYKMALQYIGASTIPTGLNFYPVTFEKKSDMIAYLDEYNVGKDKKQQIVTLDASSIITESIGDLIDIISYVLIAFAAISLLVSSVMISIITYASVAERIKEIGVLRSVGARKADIMRVFIAETVIIGFVAGIIGVAITFVSSFPLSSLFISISDGVITTTLVTVAWWHAVMLIAVSVFLTFIAGMLPARSAAQKDPVVALRSE